MTPLLDVTDLVKWFPVKRRRGPPSFLHAVDGVSLTVARGEALGLVGESGCGKSTLGRLVARLIDPTKGAIRLDGEEIGRIPAGAFATSPQRARIQMVFQDSTDSLNPRFTAFDAIADPVRRLGKEAGRRAIAARVEEAAARVGLPSTLLGRFPHQLSGGQKARVGIARGVVLGPALLVLDEPTSSLDVSVQALILQLLDALRRESGLGYLFISHDLDVVRLLCARVAVMYLGQIVETGPAAELIADPRHPYTQALIAAIPNMQPRPGENKIRLDGEPQSPIDPGMGSCRFYGRCPIGQPRCAQEAPALLPLGPVRAVACHFSSEKIASTRRLSPERQPSTNRS